MQLEKNDIGKNEIGENKHLGNNPWAGNNSSIISRILEKKFQDFPGPYQFPRTFQAWKTHISEIFLFLYFIKKYLN